jgi:hypothetical protein
MAWLRKDPQSVRTKPRSHSSCLRFPRQSGRKTARPKQDICAGGDKPAFGVVEQRGAPLRYVLPMLNFCRFLF